MTGSGPPHDWLHLRWPQIAQDDAAQWVAVLPLAATEQHGPHLPLGTDVMIAEAYLARVREMLPDDSRVLILPVQPVGISTEHLSFPGTLTLPADVALKSWTAIGESVARSGIRKLVIVTSHGGNSAAMSIVAQDLRAAQRMFVVTTSWSRLMRGAGPARLSSIAPRACHGSISCSNTMPRPRQRITREAGSQSGSTASRGTTTRAAGSSSSTRRATSAA